MSKLSNKKKMSQLKKNTKKVKSNKSRKSSNNVKRNKSKNYNSNVKRNKSRKIGGAYRTYVKLQKIKVNDTEYILDDSGRVASDIPPPLEINIIGNLTELFYDSTAHHTNGRKDVQMYLIKTNLKDGKETGFCLIVKPIYKVAWEDWFTPLIVSKLPGFLVGDTLIPEGRYLVCNYSVTLPLLENTLELTNLIDISGNEEFNQILNPTLSDEELELLKAEYTEVLSDFIKKEREFNAANAKGSEKTPLEKRIARNNLDTAKKKIIKTKLKLNRYPHVLAEVEEQLRNN